LKDSEYPFRLKYHEMTPLILSAVLGLFMAFVAYGRMVLRPIL
jgi:hypothetical protein